MSGELQMTCVCHMISGETVRSDPERVTEEQAVAFLREMEAAMADRSSTPFISLHRETGVSVVPTELIEWIDVNVIPVPHG